MSKQP